MKVNGLQKPNVVHLTVPIILLKGLTLDLLEIFFSAFFMNSYSLAPYESREFRREEEQITSQCCVKVFLRKFKILVLLVESTNLW